MNTCCHSVMLEETKMKGDPSEYYLVQILDNGGKSEFKRVNNLSFFFLMVFCLIAYLC